MEFKSPQINLYVANLTASRVFYEKLGFTLTFTAEIEGEAVHQEFVLDGFKIGLASKTSASQVHGLTPGVNSGCEIVLWTEDTDLAVAYVVENGGTLLVEPHDFLNDLRSGWVQDPDGNPLQIVSRNKPVAKPRRPAKISGPDQVAQFMEELEHPLKREIEEVRRIILSAETRLTEHIKWKAPSFCYNNEDRMTFNLQGQSLFRIIFHTGAKVQERQGEGPLFDDPTGLLEWVTGDRAVLSIKNWNDLESKRAGLAQIVSRWIKETT